MKRAARRAGRTSARSRVLDVPRFVQPDDVSCGPTCLAQVFEHWGDHGRLAGLLARTRRLPDGGTLAVFLGNEALEMGYRVRAWPYDTRIFDPTWFALPPETLCERLRARAAHVRDPKLRAATEGYHDFVVRGGEVRWRELTPALLVGMLDRGRPILAGLNGTYLYRTVRERPDDNVEDDVRGEPVGHFVVICGYRRGGESFVVRDPSVDAPFSRSGRYTIGAERLVNSVLMGENTYDDVLLEVWPRGRGSRA
jgi:hypothetical protein